MDSPIFSLEHLDLSENHLHVIHPYVLSGFPSLKSLNLSNNGLHTVAATAISLPALEALGKFKYLPNHTLPSLKAKKMIIIGSNLNSGRTISHFPYWPIPIFADIFDFLIGRY